MHVQGQRTVAGRQQPKKPEWRILLAPALSLEGLLQVQSCAESAHMLGVSYTHVLKIVICAGAKDFVQQAIEG